MKGYLALAEDIRGHFCLGRVFSNRLNADKYAEYIETEMMDKHIDTAEGGHYFIFSSDVVEIELDEDFKKPTNKNILKGYFCPDLDKVFPNIDVSKSFFLDLYEVEIDTDSFPFFKEK